MVRKWLLRGASLVLIVLLLVVIVLAVALSMGNAERAQMEQDSRDNEVSEQGTRITDVEEEQEIQGDAIDDMRWQQRIAGVNALNQQMLNEMREQNAATLLALQLAGIRGDVVDVQEDVEEIQSSQAARHIDHPFSSLSIGNTRSGKIWVNQDGRYEFRISPSDEEITIAGNSVVNSEIIYLTAGKHTIYSSRSVTVSYHFLYR